VYSTLKFFITTACLLVTLPVLAQTRFIPSTSGSDQVVYDSKTGLTWRRCSEGQAWDGSTCTGTPSRFTHEQALAYAKTQTGWRLPSVKELSSIVDLTVDNPAINSIAFPGAGHGGAFWSSTPNAANSGLVWYVDFTYGQVNTSQRVTYFNNYIRLVR
jgi:hypothetical protein